MKTYINDNRGGLLMRKSTITLIVLFVFISTALFAGTTGKIVGKVKSTDGKPLAYAAVVIEGIRMGATTDERGKFIIINVPPGKYSVLCNLMGYAPQKMENVNVQVDMTQTVNFKLKSVSQALDIKVEVVQKKEEMIKKDNTGSSQKINAESIEDVATDDISGLIAMKAGATQSADGELHVRGGTASEVNYTVDGMSVSDPVDGGSALSVDTDAVAFMDVITGGLPAEFGNAQSGMVNIVTKSGGKDYAGKIEMSSDHLIGDGRNSDEIKFNLGGPLLGYAVAGLREKLTFFLNGGAKWSDGKYRDYYVSDPVKELKYLANPEQFDEYDPYESRDELVLFDLGSRNFNTYQLNLKTQYQIDPKKKITFSVRGSRDLSDAYAHSWKYALENYYTQESNMRQYVAAYDQLIGSSLSLNVKASYFVKELVSGPKGLEFDDFYSLNPYFTAEAEAEAIDAFLTNGVNADDRTFGLNTLDYDNDRVLDRNQVNWEYNISGEIDPYSVSDLGFTSPGSYYNEFVDDKTETYSFRTDVLSQLNEIHEIKTGFEMIHYTIQKNQITGPADIVDTRYASYVQDYLTPEAEFVNAEGDTLYYYTAADRLKAIRVAAGITDGYEAKPWQFAYYLQDKMEWEGMIVNAGIRFDFWYLGKDYQVKDEAGNFRTRTFDEDDRLKVNVSPRIGFSYPISERDVLRFSYNYQNQLPAMKYIFTSKTVDDALVANNVQVGNPNLDPQLTITYEVGLQHQISDIYVMDVAAYYKNTYNYVSQEELHHPIEEQQTYSQFISEDYGSAQGIDMNISRALSNFISGSVSYSLSWANGNFQSTDLIISEDDKDLREYPLDWDTRHTFSLNAEFRVGNDEEWMVPFTDVIFPMDDFAVNATYHFSSGSPYTAVNEEDTPLERNGERMDTSSYTDLKIVKNIGFGSESKMKMKLYCTINNLFDQENQNYVYAKTGNTYDDGNVNDHENTETGVTNPESEKIRSLFLKNPAMVSSGRTVIFGISYKW
jgi:YD repeat-containing protein